MTIYLYEVCPKCNTRGKPTKDDRKCHKCGEVLFIVTQSTMVLRHQECPQCGTWLHDQGYMCHMCGCTKLTYEVIEEKTVEEQEADLLIPKEWNPFESELFRTILALGVIALILYWIGALGLIMSIGGLLIDLLSIPFRSDTP